MGLFTEPSPVITEHQRRAEDIVNQVRAIRAGLVQSFRALRAKLWGVNGYTVADAQLVIDALGDMALPIFQVSGACGQFINTQLPGELTPEELTPPVAFNVVDGKVVLDPEAKYQTEAQA